MDVPEGSTEAIPSAPKWVYWERPWLIFPDSIESGCTLDDERAAIVEF